MHRRGGAAVALCVVLVAVLDHTRAMDFSFGSCPDKEVVQNFDVGRYKGLWYETARYWQFFELNGKCVTAEYTINGTNRVTVNNSMVDSITHQPSSIVGFAELSDPTANPPVGKLAVTFKIPVVGDKRAPYWVLDTDYANYALVYSCSPFLFGALKVESAWILSRTPQIKDPAVQEAIKAAVTKAELNWSSFLDTVQDCTPTQAPFTTAAQ